MNIMPFFRNKIDGPEQPGLLLIVALLVLANFAAMSAVWIAFSFKFWSFVQ